MFEIPDSSTRELTFATRRTAPSNNTIKRFLPSFLSLASLSLFFVLFLFTSGLFFLASRRLTPVVHAGQVGTIRTVRLRSGLVAFQSRLLRASPPRCCPAKRREKGGALSQFGDVSGICSFVSEQHSFVHRRKRSMGPHDINIISNSNPLHTNCRIIAPPCISFT